MGVLEARRLYTARVRGREQDQLRLCRVSCDVGPESGSHEQMQPLDGRVQRAGRDAGRSTVRLLRRQDVDALGAELDSVGDRRVVDHASIDQPLLTDRDRGKYPWDR